ncbi:MAG: hypothetical protein A2790_22070 [Phenylobacterium sp. RIFCSPHIGHO2_01_FULL_69_31]|nr:MAG: hypothetical protein A2790_22070 [Phenylobacterium sp. RIFCSPHIGHO2_01_FULL_69_31]
MLGELLAHHARPHLFKLADAQCSQRQGPVRQADQAVHLQADRFQDLADLPVLALVQGYGEPEVGTLGSLLGLVQLGLDGPIAHAVDSHALLQRVQLLLGRPAMGAGAIAADDLGRGHLQRAGQLAVVGQQQQALGIDVEAAYRDQPRQAGRQGLEHRRAPVRVLVRGHQAHGLVVAEQARRLGLADHLAVDGDDVAGLHLHRRGVQRAAVDGDAVLRDQPLDVPARADARAGQQLGDAFSPLGVGGFRVGVVGLTWVVGLGS